VSPFINVATMLRGFITPRVSRPNRVTGPKCKRRTVENQVSPEIYGYVVFHENDLLFGYERD
jgi:hypothetical protein